MNKKFALSALSFFFLIIAYAQNVGIGTTTPLEKLDVNGNLNISGTIKTNGVAGTSGQVLTSTGAGLSWGSGSLGSQAGYKHCQMYFTAGSDTWTVPAGVTEIMVEAWGGGSGSGDYVGGTSGGYSRTVQSVIAGSVISYTVGGGGAGSYGMAGGTAGTDSKVVLAPGNLIALGGGAPFSLSYESFYGPNHMNPASGGAYYMAGNVGTAQYSVYGQKDATTFVETTYFGSGGAPVGLLNSSPNPGMIIHYENGTIIYAVNPLSAYLPSTGGSNGQGADGMVIFWWN